MTTKPCLFLAALALLTFSGEAAAGNVDEAARAFAEGQRAQLRGDYGKAAEWFELANSVVPTKEALRSAIRAHLKAGRFARAATLSEAARTTYAADTDTVLLANEVLEEVANKLGRIQLSCAGGCTVSANGRVMSLAKAPHHVLYLPPGEQRFVIRFGAQSVAQAISTTADMTTAVDVRPPTKQASRSPALAEPKRGEEVERRRNLPRGVPIVGAALTLAAAGVATWSSLDTRDAHKAYVAKPEPEAWRDGRWKQLRTNILWGVTAGLGAITLISAYWTNWHPGMESAHLAIAPSSHGATLTFSAPF